MGVPRRAGWRVPGAARFRVENNAPLPHQPPRHEPPPLGRPATRAEHLLGASAEICPRLKARPRARRARRGRLRRYPPKDGATLGIGAHEAHMQTGGITEHDAGHSGPGPSRNRAAAAGSHTHTLDSNATRSGVGRYSLQRTDDPSRMLAYGRTEQRGAYLARDSHVEAQAQGAVDYSMLVADRGGRVSALLAPATAPDDRGYTRGGACIR